jgi:Tol biopolymer transport system component
MRRWAALSAIVCAAVVAHCGGDEDPPPFEVPLPDRGGVPEASAPDVDPPDAAAPCDRNKPFGAPVAAPGLDPTIFAATPRLSADELTLYFTGRPEAGAATRLMRATRATTTSPFGAPEVLGKPSSTSDDHDPAVAADGLSLWFHSSRSGNPDIYTSTLGGADFGAAAPVTAVNTDAGEAHAYFWFGGSQLWFSSDRGKSWDLYTATGKGFGPPKKVTELSSPDDDWQPMITEDGLTVVFASNRDGGAGRYDLYIANRAATTAAFDPPTRIAELATADQEYAGWLSADRCRLWFSSDHQTPGVHHSIYVATRPR